MGVLAFGIALVISAGNASVPVGASGSMPGMTMGTGTGLISVTMHDIYGRRLVMPGGKPGAVVFIRATGCGECVAAVRTLVAQARRAHAGDVSLTVIGVDSIETRQDFASFARAAGHPPVSYVLDDRNNSLASIFGASSLGATVVYDRSGKVLDRPSANPAAVFTALRRAAA